MSRGNRCVAPAPGMAPIRASVRPSCALSAAMRMSQASAIAAHDARVDCHGPRRHRRLAVPDVVAHPAEAVGDRVADPHLLVRDARAQRWKSIR